MLFYGFLVNFGDLKKSTLSCNTMQIMCEKCINILQVSGFFHKSHFLLTIKLFAELQWRLLQLHLSHSGVLGTLFLTNNLQRHIFWKHENPFATLYLKETTQTRKKGMLSALSRKARLASKEEKEIITWNDQLHLRMSVSNLL